MGKIKSKNKMVQKKKNQNPPIFITTMAILKYFQGSG